MKALLNIYKKSYQKKYLFFSIGAILMIMADIMISLLIPYLSKAIIDEAIPSKDLEQVYRIGAIVVGIALGAVVSTILNNIFAQYVATSVTGDLRKELFGKIQQLSLADVDYVSTGRLMTIVTNDTNQIQLILIFSFRAILRAPITLIGAMVMAYVTNQSLFAIVLFAVPTLAILLIRIFRKASPLFSNLQRKVDDLNSKLSETIGGSREVKAFVTALEEEEKFAVVNEEHNNATIAAHKTLARIHPSVSIVSNLSIAAVIFFAGVLMKTSGVDMAGTIMTYISYVQQIIMSLMMLSMISVNLSRAMISANRIEQILSIHVQIESAEDAKKFNIKGSIEFKNVSFSYSDEEGTSEGITIKDVNLKIEAGSKIGLIGSTGSGKSTMMMLIPRMYECNKGEILIDGINVQDIDVDALRSQISLVTQEAIIFGGTFRSNILQGKDDATMEEIVSASVLADADEFISKKDKGYDGVVEQGGSNLSGGQKQRLSLARALVRQPKILILDDSTSAVDAKTEKKIKENLHKISTSTVIIVSQKISSIIDCDKIIVLNNNGEIDAYGPHDKILKESRIYQEIYQSQFGGALNE